MEGGPEGLDEDIPRDEEPVVLWEKCIQQSIIVDLSEDESLHLSDFESSLAFHVSQEKSAHSEASIHLSGCGELSEYDSSTQSIINSRSERQERNHTKSSAMCVSVKRPNTAVDVCSQNLHHDDPGQNTSDEDHEELPYDGDLGSPYFNQASHSDFNQDGGETSSEAPDFHHIDEPANYANHEQAPVESIVKAIENIEGDTATNLHTSNQVLGNTSFNRPQFLTKDDLLRSGRLIEAETLPEVSLLESVDDTVFSRASMPSGRPHPYNCGSASISETNHSSCPEQKSNNMNVCSTEAKHNHNKATSSLPDSITLNSASDSSKHKNIIDSVSDEAEDELKEQKAPLLRAISFTEIKYGQGQVHYPLPDFSKVAPKVKFPKTSKDASKAVQQPPSPIHRAHSSPETLDVVSRILEDSELTPEQTCVFTAPDKPLSPALVQHLQAKYDKLLAKYAEAENLIDQLRLGTNPTSELQGYFAEEFSAYPLGRPICSSDILADKMENKLLADFPTTNNDQETVPSLKPEVGPSDGEIMTTELSDIVTQFMQNAEEFQVNVGNRSINLEEQQMMFRSLVEAQDQLERKYMCKKEEHRALEMQNYMGICRNTGTFDPDRLVEGGIFRLGMLLEDIKEMIDKNLCEQVSPPQSSSTPLPFSVLVQSDVLCMSAHSPPLSLHELMFQDQSTSFSIEGPEEGKLDTSEASAGHVNNQVEQSNELIITEPSIKTKTRFSHTRLSQTFQKDFLIPSAEDKNSQDEESVLTEATGHSNILAYFGPTKEIPGKSLSPTHSSLERPPQPDCDLDNSLSLFVEVSCSTEVSKDSDCIPKPPLSTAASQRHVSLETDSGFGSSYLNQSASGSFQQNLNESFNLPHDPITSSESEGSCSNIQTTIEPATLTKAQWAQPSGRLEPPSAENPVQQWIESTSKEALVRVQGTKHCHMSEPVLSKMCTRGSPTFSCSCNNEAILALQSEVSRLKKDMKEGLIQLPHLAERLDHLASKHRHERATKTKPRSHQCSVKSASNGLTINSPVKLDWISTDMDPSKNKATDNEDTTASEMQFDYSPIEGRSGSHFAYLDSGLHSPGAPLSSRAFGERWSPLYSTPIQKPLLQVNYGSSSSLPASYKLREYPLQPTAQSRKKSTQSDTALLPSNVYFQRTLSPLSAPSKLGGRIGGHGGSKEEDIHHTLDQAIEVARNMKKTTDRMAKSISADLAKAKLQRKLYRGRKHNVL